MQLYLDTFFEALVITDNGRLQLQVKILLLCYSLCNNNNIMSLLNDVLSLKRSKKCFQITLC